MRLEARSKFIRSAKKKNFRVFFLNLVGYIRTYNIVSLELFFFLTFGFPVRFSSVLDSITILESTKESTFANRSFLKRR